MECLEDGHVMARLGQLAGRCQAGRARAHDGHPLAAGRMSGMGHLLGVLQGPVGHEPLQRADGHRLPLPAPEAASLALALLRADPTGHAGKGVVIEQRFRRAVEVAFGHQVDEAGDIDPDRAALDAQRVLALEATLRLGGREHMAEAQVDLGEALRPDVGVLGGHPGPLQGHPLAGVVAGSLAHDRAPSTAWSACSARPGSRHADRRWTAASSNGR